MATGTKPGVVAHVSSAHPYTDNRIHYRECSSLADAGYDVRLVATESDLDGEATNVAVTTLRRRRRLRRMIVSSAQAVVVAVRTKARVVHLHDPELIPYIPVLRLMGRVVVYDAHEDLPVQILDKPYVNRWTRSPLTVVTRILLGVARQADLVVAATETIAKRFPGSKTVLVRNFPPLRDAESAPPASESRNDVAIYIGGMSRTRGTAELLRAVEDPAFPEGWELHLAGPLSADVQDLVEKAVRRGRTVYHGQLAPLAARDLLLSAKVGLVTLQGTLAYRDSLPTKLFEYFAAGLPAVASDFPLWRSIIEEAGGGTLVDETDPSAIASAIGRYAGSQETWDAHSRSGNHAAKRTLNWAHEGKTLVDAYQRLMSAPTHHG